MNILLVFAHPRRNSLTGQVAAAFAEALIAQGHRVEWAELVQEGFDPVLREADEPDWTDAGKSYSPEVQTEIARIRRNDATVMVFPVWWWSMPAILKGWIDRVWNHGVAYGDGVTFPHRSVRMIALAGTTEATFAKRGYDRAIETQLATGILDFCGIPDFRLEIIHGVIGKDADPQEFLERARAFGAAFRPSI